MSKTQDRKAFKQAARREDGALNEARKAEISSRLTKYRQRSSILFRPTSLEPHKLLGETSLNGHQLVDRGAIEQEFRRFAVESHPDYHKIVLDLIDGKPLDSIVTLYTRPTEGHDLLISDLEDFQRDRLQPAIQKLIHGSAQTIGNIASLDYFAVRFQIKEQRLADCMDRAAAQDDWMALAAMDRVDTSNLRMLAELTGQLEQKPTDNRTAVIVMPALEADSLAPRREAIVGLPRTEPGVGFPAIDLLAAPTVIVEASRPVPEPTLPSVAQLIQDYNTEGKDE